jgi:RimJ/RimL family protein N-acetyltransferase
MTGSTATSKENSGGGASRSQMSFDGPRLTAVPATREHTAQIQACFEGAPDYFARTEGRPPGPDAAEQLISDSEADDGRKIWALIPRAGGPAVGVLDLHLDYPEPLTAHIGLLLFREACQGLGYGKETITAVESGLKKAGFRALRLSIVEENAQAKVFWEHLQFAEVGKLDRGVTVYEKVL